MIGLENLPKTTVTPGKRVGRGYGSGKGGHTVGRGSKGQKARGKVGLLFEGTKMKKSLLKRLPLLRGKGRLKSKGRETVVINLKFLNLLPAKEEVTIDSLDKYGVISKKDMDGLKIKILGEGDLSVPLIVRLPVSKGARQKIEKAGGRVEGPGPEPKNPETTTKTAGKSRTKKTER
jgi:large subunit ribosomal protein L15